jgi:hypothetical protein
VGAGRMPHFLRQLSSICFQQEKEEVARRRPRLIHSIEWVCWITCIGDIYPMHK